MRNRRTLGSAVYQWLDARLPVTQTVEYFSKKVVPRHKHTHWYLFGGLTLFFFLVQVVTGVLLAMYYKPSVEHAHDSIRMIVNEVPHGWLIRSLHSWAANLMIGTLFIHMFSVFLLKSYRKPRELMWLSGVLLLFLALAFGFTGYLLPWDTTAYFATLIGTQVPKTLPLVGDWGISLLSGGDDIGAETLTRMYTIHIIILPLISVIIVSFHLLLNQLLGSSIPLGAATKAPPVPFFPNYVFRDLVAWCLGLVALVSLAALLPWGLGEKANPFSSAPVGIKPEWYFLPLYQSLRMVPSRILFVNGEFIVNALVVVASLFWLAVPVLDRRSQRGESGWAFTVVGITVILYLTLTIFLAYTT